MELTAGHDGHLAADVDERADRTGRRPMENR
jgi:hypothetical protein